MPIGLKPEKKDNKQILLDLVEQRFGLQNAVRMEESLKNEKKQIADFHQQGGSSSDFAKSIGVDLPKIDLLASLIKNQGSVKATGEGQPQTPQTPQPQQQGGGVMSTALPALGKLLMAMGEGWQGQPYGSTALRQSETQLNLAKAGQVQQMAQGKGVYQFNPFTGELEQVGTVEKGAEVRNVQVSPEERAKAYGEVQKEVATYKSQLPTTEMKNMLLQTENQMINIEAMEKESENLSGGFQGMFDYTTGQVTRGAMSGAELMYMKKIPAISAGMYRALTGDNRLSDRDASERAKPLLWDVTLDKKLRKPMFQFLKDAFKVRQDMLKKKIYQVRDGKPYIPLEQVISETNKKSDSKVFMSAEEALNSGFKGEAIINGRRARID